MAEEVDEPRAVTPSWREFRQRSGHAWLVPFLFVDWVCARLAWNLSRWSLLKVLAYAETFSVLVALVVWVAEVGDRTQQRHYQAWQVINTAQGKGGNGGRIDALQELNADHVVLIGVDVAGAFLQNLRLDGAQLRRANFNVADLRNSHFHHAGLQDVEFTSANLRSADLRDADLMDADLTDADLTAANLRHADLRGTRLEKADLRRAELGDFRDWEQIGSIHLANIHGARNTPTGFQNWAIQHGAVDEPSTERWNALLGNAKPSVPPTTRD